MKEFIDKLISRLGKESDEWLERFMADSKKGHCNDYADGSNDAFNEAISIVNELAEEYKGGWIPCSVGMPKDFEYVYATCVSLIDDREPWVIEDVYHSLTGWGTMSPMLSYGEAKVVAWMPHELPAPYTEG